MIRVGATAPNFLLPGCGRARGRLFDLGDAAGPDRVVLAFSDPAFPGGEAALSFASWFQFRDRTRVWAVTPRGGAATPVEYPVPVLADRNRTVADAYDVPDRTPVLVLVDGDRTVRVAGPLDPATRTALRRELAPDRSATSPRSA